MKHYVFENAAVRLAGVDATREILEPMFAHRDFEMMLVAMCDDNLRLVHLLTIPGNGAQATVPLAKVMRQAVKNSCTGVVLAHNHPSGELRPSRADFDLTKRACNAGDSVGITILDHLIFNHGAPFSFRQRGML